VESEDLVLLEKKTGGLLYLEVFVIEVKKGVKQGVPCRGLWKNTGNDRNKAFG
jgi:hypothetical protein